MERRPQIQHKREIIGMTSSFILLQGYQTYAEGLISALIPHPDALANFLLHNTGDVLDTFFFSALAPAVISLARSKRLSIRTKLATGIATSLTLLTYAETVGQPASLFGVHDLKDIPFGILGTALWVGAVLADQRASRRNNPLG